MVLHSPSSHLLLSSDSLCSRSSCAWGSFARQLEQAEAALRHDVTCLVLVSGPLLPTCSVFACVLLALVSSTTGWDCVSRPAAQPKGLCSKKIASLPPWIPKLYSQAPASPRLLWHYLPSSSLTRKVACCSEHFFMSMRRLSLLHPANFLIMLYSKH